MHSGDPLPAGEPLNLGGPGTCRVDSLTSYMYCPSPTTGNGTTPPEQFVAIRPDGLYDPIQAGEPTYLKSVQTGLYCRVVAAGTRDQILCDQPTTATASQLTYTGFGVSYNGDPLINPYTTGGSGPLYFGNPGDTVTPVTADPPPLPPNQPINILGSDGNPVRNDDPTSAAYVGAGDGTSPYEQYVAYDPSNPSDTTPIQPGETTILKNVRPTAP